MEERLIQQLREIVREEVRRVIREELVEKPKVMGERSKPLSPNQIAIYELLKESPEGLTQKDIMEKLGLPQSSVSNALKRLNHLGFIEEYQKKVGESIIKVYRLSSK
jgi:DNA-binding MarR family transcriptional regulator